MRYLRPFLLGIASIAGSVILPLAVLIFIANYFIGRNLRPAQWTVVWTLIGMATLGFWTFAVLQWKRAYELTRGLPNRRRITITLVLSGAVALVAFVAAILANIRNTCDC